MRKNTYIIIFIILLGLVGCSSNRTEEVANYYILNYIPHLEDKTLIRDNPFPYQVQITETKLPRTYEKNKIVSKNSINTITYLKNNLWADKLYNTVPQLLLQKTSRYNFFELTQSDFSSSIPDFYIDTFISNIEQVESDNFPLAHVKMDIYLRNAQQQIVVVHRFNKEDVVNDYSVNSVVQQMNEIISVEYDEFLRKVDAYFINGVESKHEIPQLFTKKVVESDDVIEIASDDSQRGELIVPNLSKQTNAPRIKVMGINSNMDREINMGQVVSLPQGKYTLYAGQGQDVDIVKNVEIHAKYRTIVDPSWGSLIINVMDDTKTKVRMQYDIYAADNNEPIGIDFSVTDDAGDDNRVWILEPGRYFITVNGAPYSSYTDFYTLDIKANKNYNLTMVVDEDGIDSKLVGAGIHPQEDDMFTESFYSSQNAFHLNFNISADNSTAKKDYDQSINLSSQFDKKMYYVRNNIDYEGRINWEVGLSKASEQDIQISNDDFTTTNTLIYNLFGKSLGFYGRYDLSSHFFPQYNYHNSTKNYKIYDANGVEVISENGVDRVKMQNPFFPLGMKEGLGLNYRFSQGKYGNINLRGGLGWQQDYYKDVLILKETDSNFDGILFDEYREQDNLNKRGIETSIIGNINIPQLRMSWSSTAELLIPLEKNSDLVFDFDNIFNIKLINNISWDVKVNMNYDKDIKDYMVFVTSSFIRLSYFF